MKYIFILFYLVTTTITCCAQTESNEINFIRFIVGRKHIIYTKKLEKGDIEFITEELKKDTLEDNSLGYSKGQRLVLTTNERSYIENEIEKLSTLSWKDNIVDSSKALSRTDVEEIKIYKVIRGYNVFYYPEEYGGKLYSFSKPIFIRDNSICIFYFGFNCGGLCGHYEICVYERKGNTWKKRLLLSWIDN